MEKAQMAACGKLELSNSQKHGLIFAGAFVAAGLVLSTVVFPFWNFFRDEITEEVTILNNDNGICYVQTKDNIPKTIENCQLKAGDTATIKFGEGLAWASIVTPQE